MTNSPISTLSGISFSPEDKNDAQKKAWSYLSETGLPERKSESYKFTPIVNVLNKHIDWAFKGSENYTPKELYQLEGDHLIFVNGQLIQSKSTIQNFEVKADAVKEGKHDPFSLLNTAFAKEEVHLSTEKAYAQVTLYHFTSSAFINPRIRVKIKSNQKIEVVQKVIPSALGKTFTNAYIAFEVAGNGVGCLTKIQDYPKEAYSHESTFANVDRDGKFYDNTYSFGGALVRNNLTINLKGENCEGFMNGIFLIDGKSHVDNHTTVDHQKPNSYSNELYKGILDEKATGVFNGKIYVRKDAQKTNAFQSNNNILLSNEATVHTKPQLEIWADDVKCSHGCTSGQLNEDAIFYLRTRGIDEQSAKGLLLNAFAGEALQYVTQDVLRSEIKNKISEKLG